jgi:hypothetical protein
MSHPKGLQLESNKTLSAQKVAISCFMAKNGHVHRMATHTPQSPPQEICNKANGFPQKIVPIVNNGNRLPAFTLNMDQTPVNHAMNPKNTIDRRGTRTINLRMAGRDSMQVTVAVMITVSGHQLPLLDVFKDKSIHLDTANTVTNIMVDCCILIAGMPNGTIARREVPTLPAGSIYCFNEKAWFNEQIMHDWIKHALAPYVATAPPGIIPILFLDQFRIHKMGLIINAIQALGVQVEFIPACCTGLVQPVDVGFNKAFKCKMQDKFLKWMMMQDPNLPIPGSMRHNVAQWIINAQNNICVETICNAWRKTGFSYYPKNQ